MESTGRRSSIMLVLLMVLMVFSHSVGATITPDINYNVIDSALVDSINSEDNVEHPVIVQFSVEMNAQIRAFLITIDVTFEDEFVAADNCKLFPDIAAVKSTILVESSLTS